MKKSTYLIVVLIITLLQTINAQDTLVLQPGPEGKDAYLNDFYTTNWGDYPNNFACAGTSSGSYFISRSIMEFDLTSIPPGSYIIDARLNLYFANNIWNPHYHYGENSSLLQRVIEPWDEHTVTWYNQPPVTNENEVSLPPSKFEDQDYLNISVTNLVQDMIDYPESSFGFLFRLQTEEAYRRLMFASSDYENPEKWPKLVVVYSGCPPPTVSFESQVNGMQVDFTGICETALSWHWDFGDGETDNTQNPEHTYLNEGYYTVCLTVEDSCASSQYCEELEICAGPPSSEFTYSTDGLTAYFQNTTVVADSCFWDFGDGYLSSLFNPSHTYDQNGDYVVCLTIWNNCGVDTSCIIVNICSDPVVGFSYEIEGLNVYFENLSSETTSYFWDFGDEYYSVLENPWHEYAYPGSFNVCLTGWNNCGSDTVCQIIDFDNAVGIQKINKDDEYVLFPNPAKNNLFIKSSFNGTMDVDIYNMSGQILLTQQFMMNDRSPVSLDISNLNPGLYLLRCETGGKFTSMKFSKL